MLNTIFTRVAKALRTISLSKATAYDGFNMRGRKPQQDGQSGSSRKSSVTSSTAIEHAGALSAVVVAAALRSWGLLATTRSDTWLADECFRAMTPVFCQLLDHQSLDVRAAAGECSALLFQKRWEMKQARAGHCRAVKTDDSDRTYQPRARASSIIAARMSRRLKEASRENSKRRSKKDLKEQRRFFRDVCRTLDSGDSPEIILKVRGLAIQFASWSAIIRLRSFRACLGPGLIVHLHCNSLLRDVFELGPVPRQTEALKTMSKLEKRMFRSPNSDLAKERTQKRAKERKKRRQQKQSFLTQQ
jgi:hypothetical protein